MMHRFGSFLEIGVLHGRMSSAFDIGQVTIISLATLILGAWLGSRFSYRHNLALQENKRQREIDGILAGIVYELEVLGSLYERSSGPVLEEAKGKKYYDKKFLLTKDYFIVYPKNTSIIGQLEDPAVCKAIVETYNLGNFLIENFEINNVLLDERNELVRAVRRGGDATATERLEHQEMMLSTHFQTLTKAHDELKNVTGHLLEKIKHYRLSHAIRPVKWWHV
jgi:hypothetical protein